MSLLHTLSIAASLILSQSAFCKHDDETKSPHLARDGFGNILCFTAESTATEQTKCISEAIRIKESESHNKPGGVIVYDRTKPVLQTEHFIDIGVLSENYAYKGLNAPVGAHVYYLRLSGTAPETIVTKTGTQIRSGLVLVKFRWEGKLYFLAVKDKTKKLITIPGGTQNRSEYHIELEDEKDLRTTAIRELAEETGLQIDSSHLKALLKMLTHSHHEL